MDINMKIKQLLLVIHHFFYIKTMNNKLLIEILFDSGTGHEIET